MSEKPSPIPSEAEGERPKPLPTRMEKESKEFRESLTPEEKEAVKTRHRSVAQLERHGAEVTEEGRLRVTGKQVERARGLMERELRGKVEEKEPSKKSLGERLGASVKRFGEQVGRVIDRGTPRVEALIKRGKELGIRGVEAIKTDFISAIDLPARYGERMLERATDAVEKLQEAKRADEEAYRSGLIRLEEGLEQRIQVEKKAFEEFTEACKERKEKIIETYGKAGELSERVRAEREEEIEALRDLWRAEKAKLAEFERQERERFEQEADQLDERFTVAVMPLIERLEQAIVVKEEWEERAVQARKQGERIRAFLGIESEGAESE